MIRRNAVTKRKVKGEGSAPKRGASQTTTPKYKSFNKDFSQTLLKKSSSEEKKFLICRTISKSLFRVPSSISRGLLCASSQKINFEMSGKKVWLTGPRSGPGNIFLASPQASRCSFNRFDYFNNYRLSPL